MAKTESSIKSLWNAHFIKRGLRFVAWEKQNASNSIIIEYKQKHMNGQYKEQNGK